MLRGEKKKKKKESEAEGDYQNVGREFMKHKQLAKWKIINVDVNCGVSVIQSLG